jgi:HK97 family phage major capsid protein/HK97 family phage prohead protease
MLERAYGFLHIKSLEDVDEYHVISGIASTPEPDRMGDEIDPAGMTFAETVPLLLGHDKALPVGKARFSSPSAAGLMFEAWIPIVRDPGIVKDRVDLAWHSIKHGLMTGVSIGFRTLDKYVEKRRGGGRKFLKTEICELSIVTIPANREATILTLRSLDLAAPGRHPSSGTSDKLPIVNAREARPAMTISEQIQTWSNARAPKAARMSELIAKSGAAGSTLNDGEATEFDELELEIKSIDEQLRRARVAESINLSSATPIKSNGNGNEVQKGAELRSGVVTVKANVPQGTSFVRASMALLQANGNKMQAVEIAKQWKDSTPEVELFLKAAIAAGNTTDATWAGPLALASNVAGEFIALLRPRTILGKIPNLRKVPFGTSVPIQSSGGTYGWVGQGAPKPVTKLGFGTATLAITKAAGIIVFTEELARLSTPSAEEVVRNDMIAGIAAFLDQQFIDPAVAAVANVSPASITNGIAGTAAANDPLKDLHTLAAALTAANIPLAGVTFIMSESNGFALGLMRDGSGGRVFQSASADGGSLEGINLVTSNAAGTNVIAVQGSFILYADEGGVNVDVSREASVQMDSAPANPADATTVMTSLWQNNLVGLRAERFINWQRPIVNAVKVITGAAYAPSIIGLGATAASADESATKAKKSNG